MTIRVGTFCHCEPGQCLPLSFNVTAEWFVDRTIVYPRPVSFIGSCMTYFVWLHKIDLILIREKCPSIQLAVTEWGSILTRPP